MLPTTPKAVRAVYFEDDERTIDLVKLSLRHESIEVIGLTDARDAVEMVNKYAPRFIMLDLMMPGVDGWDVFEKLKADDFARNIPVIVVTAKAQGMDRTLGLHIAKVAAYITKPFSPSELIQHVQKILAKATA